ncbi:MAG: hypothetical protein ABJA67_18095, partial [Chthonomonadales bacterium]
CCQDEAATIGHDLIGKVQAYCQDNPEKTLSDLFQSLLPNLFELLAPGLAPLSEVSSTSKLLRFAHDTHHLPRFHIVDLFLREETRRMAAQAYNDAVAGSEIYTLDKFGLGALPFDLIIPGRGRGTLRVTLRAIHIETTNPIRLQLARPINSAAELADRLNAEFGSNVVLVGKAVTLISMLGAEFIFVFNEEGSGYVTRTRQLNLLLAEHGYPLNIRPILRVKYSTWDGLSVGHASFKLPAHLAESFGQTTVSSSEFAEKWRAVVSAQQEILATLKSTLKPRDLMKFLIGHAEEWADRLTEYEQLKRDQENLWDEARAIQFKVDRLYEELQSVRETTERLQTERSKHFHSVIDWNVANTQIRIESEIAVKASVERGRAIRHEVQILKAKRFAIERSEVATALRDAINYIENKAELQRQSLVTTAILTITSLEHTNHRPTAWWLPMVDRSGVWFNRVAQTTEFYLQPMQ